MITLYAHPHDGVTDIYRDKEMTNFYCRDPFKEYRKSKERTFNCSNYNVEILTKKEILLATYNKEMAKNEDAIIKLLLEGQEGSMSGFICSINGKEGWYDVISIYLEKGDVKCHIDVTPTFSKDIFFNSLPILERMQIIDRVISINKRNNK